MNVVRTNIKRNASTQYSNFDIRSMCMFGRHVLGAGPDGVFELTCEADDDPTEIDGYIKTFALDLGYRGQKRVRYIYMNIETAGTVLVTPYVDGVAQPVVTFAPNLSGRQHMRQAVGRGSVGQYWEFKIENVDGCWFYIDSVMAQTVEQSRGRQ